MILRNTLLLRFLVIFSTLLTPIITNAEYLILIQDSSGALRLPDSTTQHNLYSAVYQTLMTYQWPMSTIIAAQGRLTDDEKQQLFGTSPAAEEIFLRNKLKAIDKRLDLVFVPTALYELTILNNGNNKTIQKFENTVASKFEYGFDTSLRNSMKCPETTPGSFLTSYLVADSNRLDAFIAAQAYCYKSINSNCTIYKKTQKQLHDAIKKESVDIALMTLARLFTINISSKTPQNIISNTIKLEYQARDINHAMLFRGTCFVTNPAENISSTPKNQFALIDTPLLAEYSYTFQPRSISYGNSLFAGFVNDPGACAYHYATQEHIDILYALFIDKLNYVNNQCNDLFLISPLPTLDAMFAVGELFHSRTKACVNPVINTTTASTHRVQGMFGGGITDIHRLFLIQRDPLEHATAFARYFLKNFHPVHLNTNNQELFKKTMPSHQKTLTLYKVVSEAIKHQGVSKYDLDSCHKTFFKKQELHKELLSKQSVQN